MLLREFFIDQIDEKQVWARKGKSVTRRYRCGSGRRKGRIVSKMQQCYAPLNLKQSVRLKQTKKKLGAKMARKANKTKRTNPASKRLKQLNRRR